MPNTPQSELAAIREDAAIFPLRGTGSGRAARVFLRITGSDATRWLNGMVTNSIVALAPGQGCYNFLLSAQGRIQGDCTIYRDLPADPAAFLLATDAAQLDPIREHLNRFIIMDDVELTPVYAGESSLLLLGPRALQHLASLDLPTLDPLSLAHASTPHGAVLLLTPVGGSARGPEDNVQGSKDAARTPQKTIPQFELRAAESTLAALRDILVAASIPEVSAAALEHLRILEGRPRFGVDIRNSETARDLPQETAQDHALHFSKGCYLGQEIVERIRSRGQVHRTFTQFRLTPGSGSKCPPELPAPLLVNGNAAGELTSAALIPLPEGPTLLALGYARREALDLHQPLTYSGGIAEPITASNALRT